MTCGGPFAGDGSHLVVAVEVVLVGAIADFYTFKQLIGDSRVAGGSEEGWEPVQPGKDAILHGVCRHMARPAQDCWHAETSFHDRSFALRERCSSTIRPGEEFGAVIGGENDDGVIV